MTVGIGGGKALWSLIMRKDVNLGSRGSGPLPPFRPSLALWLFTEAATLDLPFCCLLIQCWVILVPLDVPLDV